MTEPPPGSAHGAVGPVRVDPEGVGGPTKRQASGAEWRRSSRGLYVPSWVEQTPEQRILEAGYLVPYCGAVTGWAALRWLGATGIDGADRQGRHQPVPLAIAVRRVRPQAGVLLCEERFDVREIAPVDGIWLTHGTRSVCFAMRYAPSLREAAVVLGMAAHADLVSLEEAARWLYDHPSYTGIAQARDCLAFVDENCWSPMECRLLFVWMAVLGLPRPLMNHPLFDLDGRHIGTPDLVDVRRGVIAQYDGGLHLASAQRRRDIARDERYLAHGLEQVTVMAGDLGTSTFGERVRQTYARAERRPASDRRWTVELPPWWVPTLTVDQRRALTPDLRRRWLGFRGAA